MWTVEQRQRIELLFEEAITRPPPERDGFLRRACGSDDALYRELHSLVAHHHEASGGSWAAAAAARLLAPSCADCDCRRSAGILASGATLGPYTIISVAGSGAMGDVYRAHDARLNRDVAIKTIPPEFGRDRTRLRRLQREARALGSLNHSNIAAIHDILEDESSTYLVLEFVDGIDLSGLVQQAPLPVGDVIDIGRQIADGLQAAHSRGIVHRDLKPANIKMTPEGRIKVLDFGLASMAGPALGGHDADPSLPDSDVASRDTFVAGTPAYMSPEQARGELLDHRTDIWAFGCVMFELLTGSRAFAAAPASDATTTGTPAQPYWDLLPVATPSDLRALIRRCLTIDVDARIQTAAELLRALDVLATNRDAVPLAASVRSLSQLASSPRRRWVAAAVLWLAAIAALAALRALPSSRRGVDSRGVTPSLAILPFFANEGDDASARVGSILADALVLRVQRVPGLAVRSSRATSSFDARSQSPVAFGRSVGADVVVHGQVWQDGGRTVVEAALVKVADGSVVWTDRFTQAASGSFGIEDSITRRLVESLASPGTAGEQRASVAARGTHVPAAHDAFLRGRYYWNRRSADTLAKATALHEEAVRLDPAYALAHAALADDYASLSGYHLTSQYEMIPKARAEAQTALELDPTLAEAYTTLALIAMNYDWAWDEADRLYQRAIQLNPYYATAHAWRGEYLAYMGRFEEGLAELRRGQELDPLSLIIATDVGKALILARRYDDALMQLDRVLEVDPQFAQARLFITVVYTLTGPLDKMFEAMSARGLAHDDPARLTDLTEFYALAGRKAVSRKYLNELIAVSKHTFVSPLYFSTAYGFYGDLDQAFAWLNRMCDERTPGVIGFKVDPMLDRYRADPRFIELLRRVGFAR